MAVGLGCSPASPPPLPATSLVAPTWLPLPRFLYGQYRADAGGRSSDARAGDGRHGSRAGVRAAASRPWEAACPWLRATSGGFSALPAPGAVLARRALLPLPGRPFAKEAVATNGRPAPGSRPGCCRRHGRPAGAVDARPRLHGLRPH